MKIHICLLSILAAVSCTVMPEMPEVEENDGRLITKVAEGEFQSGDRIGLFVFESADTPFGGTAIAENVLVRITSTGSKVGSDVFFPDSPVDMFAYYPYWDDNYIVDNYITVYTYEDQRPLNQYRESEHKFVKFLNYENTGKPVNLAFERLVSRLSYELVPGNGFSSAEELMDCEIIIPNIKYNSGILLETGELKTPEGNRDFFPYAEEMAVVDGTVSGIYAMVVPQTLPKGASVANIRIGEDTFRCILDEDFIMKKGVNYTITITVDKSETKSSGIVCGGLSINETSWK